MQIRETGWKDAGAGLYHPLAAQAIAEQGTMFKSVGRPAVSEAARTALYIALCDYLLEYRIMRLWGGEGDRIYFRRRPPMAQACRSCAQIDLKLMAFAETGVGDVKTLKGVAGMRLRAGDWRVLFTIKANTITIHAVGHRRDIYD
jgi:mRNA interferase RelE/StbE